MLFFKNFLKYIFFKHRKLQCYDEDHLSSDDLLGQIDLDLSRLIKGAKSPQYCTMNMTKKKWPTIKFVNYISKYSCIILKNMT